MGELRIVYTAEDRVSPTLAKIDAANAKLQASVDRSSSALATSAARMQAVGGAMTRFGSGLSAVGKKLTTYVTLPIVGLGVLAGKASIDFQTAMTRIQTQAGASASDVKKLSAQVLELAKHAQQGPQQLADSLYHLKSVGMDNVSAMNALRSASKLAAVSGASLEDVTNALAGAWRSGIQGSRNFGSAVSVLNAIVGAGNMRMTDLIGAIGTGILPAARTFGLSIKDVGAALALMTDSGMQANSAATRLRMAIALLGAPSAKAESELKTIGLTGLDLAHAMRQPDGLLVALTLLHDHLQKIKDPAKQAQLITSAFGGGRSSAGLMTLLNNLDVLKMKYGQIDKTAGKFNSDVAKQGQTAAAKWAHAWAGLQAVGVQLGNKLVPIFTNKIVPAIESVVNWFAHLTGSQQDFIIKAGLMAAALGPVLRILGVVFKVGGKVLSGVGGILGKIAGKGSTATLGAAGTSLSDAAVALNGAATALDEAAGRLGLGGGGPGGGGEPTPVGGAGDVAGAEETGAAGGVAARALGMSLGTAIAAAAGGYFLGSIGDTPTHNVATSQADPKLARAVEMLVQAHATGVLTNRDLQYGATVGRGGAPTSNQTQAGAYYYKKLTGIAGFGTNNPMPALPGMAYAKALHEIARESKDASSATETFDTKTLAASVALGKVNVTAKTANQVGKDVKATFRDMETSLGQNADKANAAAVRFHLLRDNVGQMDTGSRQLTNAMHSVTSGLKSLTGGTTSAGGAANAASSKFQLLRDAVDSVPTSKHVKITADDASAIATVQAYNSYLSHIPRTITTVMSVSTALHGGGRLPGHAAGGPVTAGGAYMVGENGPEMFVPAQSGDIVPHHQLGGGLRFVEGRLSIDESGRAFIRGVVEEVKGEDARYARSVARQRR